MTTLIDYKGLQVCDPEPTGDGGLAIQDDFVSLVDWHPKSVWTQTTDPTVGDDSDDDFYPGSLWLRTNTTPPKLFVCRSSSVGAAVWDQVILEVVQDASPQLGGNLDVNGNWITATGGDPVVIKPASFAPVGIHTDDPLYPLHVKRPGNSTYQLVMENNDDRSASRVCVSVISDSDRYAMFGLESVAYGGKAFIDTSNSDFVVKTSHGVRLTFPAGGEIQAATPFKPRQTYSDINAATDGATVTFDLTVSNLQSVTLGGNRTLALSNAKVGQNFLITLKQDATGSRTVTWWSGISWAGGSAPTLTTTANKSDVFEFLCIASGQYFGKVWGQGM